jgi:hypothetical protein
VTVTIFPHCLISRISSMVETRSCRDTLQDTMVLRCTFSRASRFGPNPLLIVATHPFRALPFTGTFFDSRAYSSIGLPR